MDWTISRESAKLWDLAYALGAFMGDGYRGYSDYGNGVWFSVGVACMDREIVERFATQVNSVFGRDYKVQPYKLKTGTDMFRACATAREVYECFVFNTVWKAYVPEAFINCPVEVLREFIAGLFDTDGSVKKTEQPGTDGFRYQLGFGGTELGVVESVALLLQRSGVKVGKICEYRKGGYKCMHTIYPNIRSFIDAGFYFRCERKAKRLTEYLGLVLPQRLCTPQP